MRRYNEDPGHKAKLEFYGFDINAPSGAVQRALEYLQEVDPGFAREVAPMVAPLDNDFDQGYYSQLPAARVALASEGLRRILNRLGNSKHSYVRRFGEREWGVARMNAQVAIRSEQFTRKRDYDFRDRAMAENIKALLDEHPAGARMVVWALATGPHGVSATARCIKTSMRKNTVANGYASERRPAPRPRAPETGRNFS